VTDHVIKDPDARGMYSVRTPRKAELADVHLGLRVAGSDPVRVSVTKHKDRPYGICPDVPDGLRIGHVEVTRSPGGLAFVFTAVDVPDPDAETATGYWRPTHLMEGVSTFLAFTPGWHSTNKVRGAVKGDDKKIDHALDAPAREGYAEVDRDPGANRWQHSRRFNRVADELAGRGERTLPNLGGHDPTSVPEIHQGCGPETDATLVREETLDPCSRHTRARRRGGQLQTTGSQPIQVDGLPNLRLLRAPVPDITSTLPRLRRHWPGDLGAFSSPLSSPWQPGPADTHRPPPAAPGDERCRESQLAPRGYGSAGSARHIRAVARTRPAGRVWGRT
jgi:hypothetical protein